MPPSHELTAHRAGPGQRPVRGSRATTPRAVRLVCLRLGQPGVHHLGGHGPHRPLPERAGVHHGRRPGHRHLHRRRLLRPPAGRPAARERGLPGGHHRRDPDPDPAAAAHRRPGRPHQAQEALAVLAGLHRLRRRVHALLHGRRLRDGVRAVPPRQRRLWRLPGRLQLLSAGDRHTRRARPGLHHRLGHLLPRRCPAARRAPRPGAAGRLPGRHRGRGGAHRVRVGRDLVGRLHHHRAQAAAQPLRRARRPRGPAQRAHLHGAARAHRQGDAQVPADAPLPARRSSSSTTGSRPRSATPPPSPLRTCSWTRVC